MGKFVVATALLLLFYWVVLRHRASYRLIRSYLVSIPVLGVLMCILSFDVPVELPRSIEHNVEQIEQHLLTWDHAEGEVAQWNEPVQSAPVAMEGQTEPAPVQAPAVQGMTVEPKVQARTGRSYDEWMVLLVAGISVALIMVFAFYVVRMFHVKRRLVGERTDEGYGLIRSVSISTPFSFGETIFLPADLDARSEEMIVRHEKAHIAHHHYLEVWYIEFWSRLCWFNPVMWLCRSELRNVHEYEADRDVIRQGADVHVYQSTLLEMVMNESNPVVNGFNHSFIRQRFVEMKHSTAGTLGRMGKASLLLWIVVLFGSFTLRPSAKLTQPEWHVPVYPDPLQTHFLLNLVEDNPVTSFHLYMGDSLFHIDETTPDTVIPVIDNRAEYSLALDRVTVVGLRGIGPDGQQTQWYGELFLVPGCLTRAYVSRESPYLVKYYDDIQRKSVLRAVTSLRHTITSLPVGYPRMEGKVWDCVGGQDIWGISPQSVCFGEDKTWIKFEPQINLGFYWKSMNLTSLLLEDPQGNRYRYQSSSPTEGVSEAESLIYGHYVAFEPLPSDVAYFNLCRAGENDSLHYFAKNICKAKSERKPNFELTIEASPGIPDCAYIIEYIKPGAENLVAELPLDQNRQCTYTAHLDSIVRAEVTAIFPDGSVCVKAGVLPLVPGAKVKLNVYHAYWQVDGGKSEFYRDWVNAKDMCENLDKRNILPAERDSIRLCYLNQHLDRLGCLYYYDDSYSESLDEVDSLPAVTAHTQFGREWAGNAESRARRKERRQAVAQRPLWLFRSPDRPLSTIIIDEFKGMYAEFVHRGAYVLEKEYSGDDPENPYLHSDYFAARARNGVKIYKVADLELVKKIKREYKEN
ncbi:MAG: M56 family metallopeptidase [Bacteroidales bacterium]|nr:M56 family metallopeptidase [Bacteroidales bacterium]